MSQCNCDLRMMTFIRLLQKFFYSLVSKTMMRTKEEEEEEAAIQETKVCICTPTVKVILGFESMCVG